MERSDRTLQCDLLGPRGRVSLPTFGSARVFPHPPRSVPPRFFEMNFFLSCPTPHPVRTLAMQGSVMDDNICGRGNVGPQKKQAFFRNQRSRRAEKLCLDTGVVGRAALHLQRPRRPQKLPHAVYCFRVRNPMFTLPVLVWSEYSSLRTVSDVHGPKRLGRVTLPIGCGGVS